MDLPLRKQSKRVVHTVFCILFFFLFCFLWQGQGLGCQKEGAALTHFLETTYPYDFAPQDAPMLPLELDSRGQINVSPVLEPSAGPEEFVQ